MFCTAGFLAMFLTEVPVNLLNHRVPSEKGIRLAPVLRQYRSIDQPNFRKSLGVLGC